MNRLTLFSCCLLAAAMVLAAGCATSENTGRSESGPDIGTGTSIEVTDDTNTLADYIRRLSGVTVHEAGNETWVNIRGVKSINATDSPLFVIDGMRIGHVYSDAASIVDVSDIKRVRVLKGLEASAQYGLEGSSGVIEIITKDKRQKKKTSQQL